MKLFGDWDWIVFWIVDCVDDVVDEVLEKGGIDGLLIDNWEALRRCRGVFPFDSCFPHPRILPSLLSDSYMCPLPFWILVMQRSTTGTQSMRPECDGDAA